MQLELGTVKLHSPLRRGRRGQNAIGASGATATASAADRLYQEVSSGGGLVEDVPLGNMCGGPMIKQGLTVGGMDI